MSLLNEIIQKYGFEKLNSATKYPSISTYHKIGDRGRLVEELNIESEAPLGGNLQITEKIDGTNARIIIYGDDYIIGSREELIYAKGDRVKNDKLRIVEALKENADQLGYSPEHSIMVLYGEVYGGKITKASKQYTNDESISFRMFDAAYVPINIFDKSLDEISTWRQNGGQDFAGNLLLFKLASDAGFKVVPTLDHLRFEQLPKDRRSVYKLLQQHKTTKAGIDIDGKSEGIIVRNIDRSFIRKIRFEEYEKTAKFEGWA